MTVYMILLACKYLSLKNILYMIWRSKCIATSLPCILLLNFKYKFNNEGLILYVSRKVVMSSLTLWNLNGFKHLILYYRKLYLFRQNLIIRIWLCTYVYHLSTLQSVYELWKVNALYSKHLLSYKYSR